MNGTEPQNQFILHVTPQQALSTLLAQGAAPSPIPSGDPAGPPSINFGAMWKELRRRWWVVALCMLLSSGAAIAYALKAQRIFSTKATLEVQQEQISVMGNNKFGPTDLKALENLKTIESKINGEEMMLNVIRRLNLDKDPTFFPKRDTPFNDDELVYLLQKKATAALIRGTRLIEIVVEDHNPQRALDIANAFLDRITTAGKQEDTTSAREIRVSLEKERDRIREELEAAELTVKQFREAHPEMQLEETHSDLKTNVAEDRVKNLNLEVSTTKSEVVRLTNGIEQLRAAKNVGLEDLLRIPAIAALEEIINLQKVLNEKSAAFASTDARYLPKHPSHIRASRELAEVRDSLLAAARKAGAVMENKLAQAQENETKLTAELKAAKAAALEFQQVAAAFNIHARELKVQREHYNTVLTRLKEAQVSQDFGGSLLRVVGRPILPTWPIRPQKKLIVGAAGLAGTFLGLGLVLLLSLMDRSVRNLEQGEEALALPGLAAVPESPAEHPMDRLLSSPFTKPENAEAFRAMRTSLSLLGKGVTARSFLFTSPSPGDGKSYCASNYAVALALQGYRTLLIDADLRKPTLDLLFLGRRNPAGLVTHLQGDEQHPDEQSKACSPTSVANLYLFSAGEANGTHPAELLSGPAFRDLLQQSLKWFHRVVIDTPPVNAVSDALLLAREVDSVALVIRAKKTSRSDAKKAINKLTMAGGRPVGFILNGAPKEALITGYTGDFHHATHASLALPASTH